MKFFLGLLLVVGVAGCALQGSAVDTPTLEKSEDRHSRLVNAAHATEIPGLDLTVLTADQRVAALQRLNEELCNCGCKLTLAQCRINDTTCGFSLPLAEEVVAEILAL